MTNTPPAMTQEYFFYPIGTEVYIKGLGLTGIITEIILDSTGVRYMIAYFVRGEHVVEVFREVEFSAEDPQVRCWILQTNNN